MTESFPPNPRALRRGDVVHERDHAGRLTYGRVWRRHDAWHVVVVDCLRRVTLRRDDELVLTDYDGKWLWGREPWNTQGRTPRWNPMPSLRRLKSMARKYNPHFGGLRPDGRRWTKEEREAALPNLRQPAMRPDARANL